ncbi:MAG: hypothetical protein AB7S69_12540 [Salinivirgaceae bacterium]
MKKFNSNQNDLKHSMVILPATDYQELVAKVESILNCVNLNESNASIFNGYISEKDAMKETGYKSTWFWQQRTSGKLPFKKLGAKVMYKIDDLINLMEEK